MQLLTEEELAGLAWVSWSIATRFARLNVGVLEAVFLVAAKIFLLLGLRQEGLSVRSGDPERMLKILQKKSQNVLQQT